MQTVLITGVNGFVGQCLTIELLSKGYQVVGTGKGPDRVEVSHPNFHYEELDFTDEGKVLLTVKQFQPSILVHSGALSKPDECETDKKKAYHINVIGTKNLLSAASLCKSFFVFLSTDFVFSGNEGIYKEDDERAPVNYYGQTKMLAEEEVKQYEFSWSIVRTILVYGQPKGGRNNLLTMVAENLKQGKPMRIFEDQERTPTYIDDLTKGITTIIQQKATGIYHLSGTDKITVYDIAVKVAEYFNLDKSLISPVTAQTFHQPARRPPKTGFDLSKAKQELNYRPISFNEGLKKTFE